MDKILTTFILLVFLSCQKKSEAQTYVGEMLYRSSYEYIKVTCKNDTCLFSIPYLDNDNKYPITGDIASNRWEIQRGIEHWSFETALKEGGIAGTLHLPTGSQEMQLWKQKKAIEADKLSEFSGTYEDQSGRRLIVYAQHNYLHMMSPYSEETMSLKPIGDHRFWSVSGESTKFSNVASGKFQKIILKDRFGNEHQLQRSAAISIESLWIPIGKDTLFAKLYLPATSDQSPACLILPGGGGIGMENYEFEARFFASNGLVSLVFDKSGNGQSKGEGNFWRQTFEEKNDQYIALFRYLQAHPRVDPSKVGVHGPSEGGRLALMMAIDLKDEIAFVNAVAAPMMSFREGQFYAMDQHHRIMGLDESDNMDIQQIWSNYYDGIVNNKIDESIIEAANVHRQKNPRLFLPPDFSQIPTSPIAADIDHNRVVQEAAKITCPILFQYGENDQRVHRQKSLQNFLPRASNRDKINVIIYNRGSHSMMTPEYKICPGYTQDKIKWLQQIGIL